MIERGFYLPNCFSRAIEIEKRMALKNIAIIDITRNPLVQYKIVKLKSLRLLISNKI